MPGLSLTPEVAVIGIIVFIEILFLIFGINGVKKKSTLQLPIMRRLEGKEAVVQGWLYFLYVFIILSLFFYYCFTGRFNPRW